MYGKFTANLGLGLCRSSILASPFARIWEPATMSTSDKILIENQISPIANRMKTVQGMLAQFFIMKGVEDIVFVSAANKLKLFMGKDKTTYNERKKIGIEITKNILNADKNISDVEQISNSNKKDDLADCFLQGLWYILENNLAETEYKNLVRNLRTWFGILRTLVRNLRTWFGT